MLRSIFTAALLLVVSGASASAQQSSTLRATHGAWEVRCDAQNSCAMIQTHRNSSGAPDVVFTLFKPNGATGPNGQQVLAVAEIATPLGVWLPAELGVKVDANEPRGAPYERCFEAGCIVRAPVSQAMLDELKRGATATIIVSVAPGKFYEAPFSLSGFTAAFNSL